MTGRSPASVGVGLFGTEPVDRMVELVRVAEELGFRNAWIGDSQTIWRDAYVTLAAAAVATDRIVLGTGVTNAVTRHCRCSPRRGPSLAELAPGRVACAIGTGDSSLRTMGLAPQRVAELERRIGLLRTLLAGGEVVDPAGGASFTLQFAPEEPIPIYVAAASPRALRLAGRVADGVVACVGVDRRLVDSALRYVAAGCGGGRPSGRGRFASSSGRRSRSTTTPSPPGTSCVRSPPASSSRRSSASSIPRSWTRSRRSAGRYEYREHMATDAEHRELVPDRLVQRFAVAGTPAECGRALAEIRAFPIDQLAVVPFGADRADVMRRLGDVARTRPRPDRNERSLRCRFPRTTSAAAARSSCSRTGR